MLLTPPFTIQLTREGHRRGAGAFKTPLPRLFHMSFVVWRNVQLAP